MISRLLPAADAVHLLGGMATRAQLSRWSTRRSLDGALSDGLLVRARRGIYLLPELPEGRHLAAAVRGVLSHESAARELGLGTLLPPREVQLTVPRGRRHLEVPRGARLPFPQALAIADSALRLDAVGEAELVTAAIDSRGPGRPRRIRVARSATCLAANPFESGLRACVLDAGLTGFVPQFPVPGTRYRVDLADPKRRVALEADSFAHHGGRQALHRDCTRYDELVRRGWLVLRFSWEHVMFEPEWVAQVVPDTCAERRTGRRTGP